MWIQIWRYLTKALIWQLCQFSIRPSIYLVRLWNHVRICSWHQPELSNKGKVSCSRTQRGPLMGLEPTTSSLRVRRATHCISKWNAGLPHLTKLHVCHYYNITSFLISKLELYKKGFLVCDNFSWLGLKPFCIWHFLNHVGICSFNQSILSNRGKAYCSRKQRGCKSRTTTDM